MNILFVVHNYPGNGPNFGGTELHVRDMVEQYKQDESHHIWLLYPMHSISRLRYLFIDTKTGKQEHFDVSHPVTWECYQHEDFNQKIVPFLHRHKIDVVHFFHLIHFPLSFPIAAQQAGARVIISFFDYYLICRKFNLLTANDSRFCGYPNVCLSTCDLCLRQSFGYAPGTQLNRRKLVSEILYHADAVHYLCEDIKERALAAYDHLKTKPELVMGLGMKEEYLNQASPEQLNPKLQIADRQESESETEGAEISDRRLAQESVSTGQRTGGKPIRIACLGNFAHHKGADLIISVMEHYRVLSENALEKGQEAPVHFDLYGASQHSADYHINLYAKAGILTVHGKYQPEDLPRLLADCDVALFASIWPETFALVLSEVWASKIVPIAPRLGAFGERITHGVTGMLYDVVNDPGSVIDVINELTESPHKIIEMREAITRLIPITLRDNWSEYNSFYSRVFEVESETSEQLSVAQVYLPERLPQWHLVVTNTGAVAPPPPSPRQTRNQILIQRAWGVLRRRGLRYTLQASLDYMHLKRG